VTIASPPTSQNWKKKDPAWWGGGVHRETLQLRASIYNTTVAFGIVVRSGVSNHGLAIYVKMYLEAKEELWKFEYFTMQKFNLQKKSSKRNQNPSRYL
jgi:lipoate-protein ligase B